MVSAAADLRSILFFIFWHLHDVRFRRVRSLSRAVVIIFLRDVTLALKSVRELVPFHLKLH